MVKDEASRGRILVTASNGVGWITLDNAARLNAITADMADELPRGTQQLVDNESVKVIVVRGAGSNSFCAGADLSEAPTDGERRLRSGEGRYTDGTRSAGSRRAPPMIIGLLARIDKPVIAMIHGTCIGGGLALALEADIRIAADNARFGVPVANLGFAYPFEVMERLVALVGPSRASMMAFTAEPIDAHDALRVGLADRVVERAELEPMVRELAYKMAQLAPLSISASKAAIQAAAFRDRADALQRCHQLVDACQRSADSEEGRLAFIQKRRPRFQGR